MKSSVLSPDIEQKHTLPPYQEGIQAMRKKRQVFMFWYTVVNSQIGIRMFIIIRHNHGTEFL